jgi:plastocyanin
MSTEEPAGPARRPLVLAALGVAVVALLAALGLALTGAGSGSTIAVDVPPGTWEDQQAGAEVELLPRTLRVDVGDTLEIVNRDDHVHEVGPYTVGPGQTVRQTFTSPGTIEGLCTLHPDGVITIVVT